VAKLVTLQEAERAADAEKIKTKMISLIRSNLDTVVGIGLVGLAPETVTPRVTGSLGLITSLIACYQVSRNADSKPVVKALCMLCILSILWQWKSLVLLASVEDILE
jgi:hypothetical protein